MKRGASIAAVIVVVFLCITSCVIGGFNRNGAQVVLPNIQMAPEQLFPHSPVPITNTLVTTLVVDLVLIGGAWWGCRAIRKGDPQALIPTGFQNLLEMVYETLDNMISNILGDHKHHLPGVVALLMTFFVFILVANWIELIPGFDTIGIIEPVHEGAGHSMTQVGPFGILTMPEVAEGGYELIPIFRAVNTDLNLPLAMALIAMVMVQYYGVYTAGAKYFFRFFNVKAVQEQGFIGVFLWLASVLEIISEFSKIISFTFRLFGNIFAGAVLLMVMMMLVPFIGSGIFYLLELFVGFVQALVFMMLTASFITSALSEHGAEESHSAA